MSGPISRTQAPTSHVGQRANGLAGAERLAQNTPPHTSFAATLERASRALESPVASAARASGPTSPMAEAIELQARVYRDAERVELASKLLDHAVGAVKTVLQTRV